MPSPRHHRLHGAACAGAACRNADKAGAGAGVPRPARPAPPTTRHGQRMNLAVGYRRAVGWMGQVGQSEAAVRTLRVSAESSAYADVDGDADPGLLYVVKSDPVFVEMWEAAAAGRAGAVAAAQTRLASAVAAARSAEVIKSSAASLLCQRFSASLLRPAFLCAHMQRGTGRRSCCRRARRGAGTPQAHSMRVFRCSGCWSCLG